LVSMASRQLVRMGAENADFALLLEMAISSKEIGKHAGSVQSLRSQRTIAPHYQRTGCIAFEQDPLSQPTGQQP
jgi:hypothetical protein